MALAQTLTPASLKQLDPATAGLAVMTEADLRDSGFEDLSVELTMVLRDARGRENARALRISELEVEADGNKMLVVFDSPKPIRGTALLSYSHPRREDDQWLYLPALKRVKKITAHNKSGPFLSSEFAFEDLTRQEVEKFSYRYLGDEPCALGQCYRVERIPLDEFSGYSKQEVWVDQEAFRISQVDYFDRRGDPLKTLIAEDFQLYEGQFWRAQSMLMSNHQTGKSTALRWQNFRFATGLNAERDFSTNSLRRAR